MAENRVVLSQPIELDIRGTVYTVYPISIADFVGLEKSLSKLETEKNIGKIGELVTDIAYTILDKSGNKVSKDDVAKVVTIEAFQHIVKAALGTTINLALAK